MNAEKKEMQKWLKPGRGRKRLVIIYMWGETGTGYKGRSLSQHSTCIHKMNQGCGIFKPQFFQNIMTVDFNGFD